jgi:GNAT superfamily N-acetyltransferase
MTATHDPAELLRLYDDQLRVHIHDREPEGVAFDRDGPALRITGFGSGGWVMYRDLGGLEGAALDEFIARQVRYFAERSMPFEWKYRGHDLPADLPERLLAAGFVPEEQETLLVAPVDRLALDAAPPPGVVIREVADQADYDRIAALEAAVWGDATTDGWIEGLAAEQRADPDGVRVFLAIADDLAVSAGWIRFPSETDFGTLWGGSTREEWRGRGIYRSLVARRATLAAERGRRYLQVDASDDSRPILERLGFITVGTTTPYVWTPPAIESDTPGGSDDGG